MRGTPQAAGAPHPSDAQRDMSYKLSSSRPFGNSISGTFSDESDMAAYINFSRPNISNSTTPVSSRSSISHDTRASSTSSSSEVQPAAKRSSLKSSLKTSKSATNLNTRRSSAATVRFAEAESLPKTQTWSTQKIVGSHNTPLSTNRVPNPLLRYRHHRAPSFSGPLLGPVPPNKLTQRSPPLSPPLKSPTRKGPSGDIRPAAKVSPMPSSIALKQDLRWSNIPLPPVDSNKQLNSGSRVCSYQSVASDLSVQSAPAVLTHIPISPALPSQYNPLEHYVPCLYDACSVHYTTATAGPTYYLSSGPYKLSRHHSYCSQHSARDLKAANATCKREWESMRQHAGRKTLGAIATEFEIFLEGFREERRFTDARLVQEQKKRVLGSGVAQTSSKGKAAQDRDWDWRYMSRLCTLASCSSSSYSPFANHLYSFYATPRSSTFLPLQTLCPGCAKSEVERFETLITDKWNSKKEWNPIEWNEWCSDSIKDRDMELEFYLAAQEKNAREKGPVQHGAQVSEQKRGMVQNEIVIKERKSMFKRISNVFSVRISAK